MAATILTGAAAKAVLDENPNPPLERHTFAEVLKGREKEFPVLARAVANLQECWSPLVQWDSHENYTEIVRFPYMAPAGEGSVRVGGHRDKDEALTAFLARCEYIVTNGIPRKTETKHGAPKRYCGGYKHYLRRELVDTDVLKLRPLSTREPIFRRWTHLFDQETAQWKPLPEPELEWLAEFSLQVTSG